MHRFDLSSLGRAVAVFFILALAGCSCGDDDRPLTDGGMADGTVPDGAVPDGSPDGGPVDTCPTFAPPAPAVMECGDLGPAPADGTCTVTPGTGTAILISGNVLTPGTVFRGGDVLVVADRIACVGCDCSGAPGAAGATQIVCPEGVVSPGLINAHEHLTFSQNRTYTPTSERYEHRHDWRRGNGGHTELNSSGGASALQIAWGELRHLIGGATSVNGSGGARGFLRNLDRADMEGLGQPQVNYETFPLGDTSGVTMVGSCDYPGIDTPSAIPPDSAYTPHISEGINAEAQNEFECTRSGMNDLITNRTAIVHGVGLYARDIAEIAHDGTSLIWSPRSNVTLYGDTARVTEYASLGVNVALGTDWVITGSVDVLRELACADSLNRDYYHGYFSDEQLWLMATLNAARALAVDDVVGSLEMGKVADIAIFDGSTRMDHRALIGAGPSDVALVLRGGTAVYGDAALVDALAGAGCDALDVCSRMKRVCTMREIGSTLSALQAANSSSYPLFYCEEPMFEPSCVPERNNDNPMFPPPEVDGSNRYSGIGGTGDVDGDGIMDAEDNCSCVFNPVRPLDMGAQADADGDGLGDACDRCPLDPANGATCAPWTPGDRDGDGVDESVDNCPGVANPDQMDRDTDMIGDACDPCPDTANPGGGACPATVYAIKRGELMAGAVVSLTDLVVTAIAPTGFFAQVAADSPTYEGVPYSGIFAYTGTMPTDVMVGSRVDVTSGRIDFFRTFMQWQLYPDMRMARGTAPLPAPVDVAAEAIAPGGAMAAELEAVLVRVPDVTVATSTPPDFTVSGGLTVGSFLYAITPVPMVGEHFPSITGVLAHRVTETLLPRSAADVISGPPVLAALEPALSYVREGPGSGPTFPEPLVVRMSRAVETATTIMLTSSDAGLFVTNVVVPVGSAVATVPVTGMAAGTYTVTAMLDGRMATAQVRVLGATEVARLVAIEPAMQSVLPSGTLTYTARLDIPAPPGGATIALTTDLGATVPASVTVPENAIGASFTFTAGTMLGTATITGMLGSDTATAQAMVTDSLGGLVINEVDYDQPSTDTTEFIEIFNGTSAPISLAGKEVVLINGADGSTYRRIPLSGTLAAGGYLLIKNAALVAPMGVTTITIPDSSVQNGGPDGIALIDTTTMTLLDALSYEGSITMATITGAGTVSLVEGTATPAVDTGVGAQSLCRSPNGRDTDDASADWRLCTTPTPGAAN